MLRLAWGGVIKVGDESLSSYYLGKPSLHPQLQNTAKKWQLYFHLGCD